MIEKFHPVHPPPEPPPGHSVPERQERHPLFAFVCVSALATLAARLLPDAYSSSGVAALFLGATYYLCLRRHHPVPPEEYGLSLGGLLNPEPLSLRYMVRSTAKAFLLASLVALIVLPIFAWGYAEWHAPTQEFNFTRAFTWPGDLQSHSTRVSLAPLTWLWEVTLLHVVAIALPEEAFFRGYLQSSLVKRWAPRTGPSYVTVGLSIFIVSVLFALGHFATEPHPARLAVFFPSLLFGVVRALSGGIGAAVFLHAQCNIFSLWLSQGYGSH